MANRDNYLFALSFIAKDESGLALVSAPNATTAFQILKNSGRYNYGPEFYILIRSRNLGLYTCRCAELLLESYTNAEVAYEKFVSIADSFVGPAGESAGFGSVVATVDDSTGVPYVEVSVSGPDTAKNFAFSFHNLKGRDGSDAEVTAQNIQSALGYVPVAPSDISQFITKTVDDLTNYYLKSETYTKAEVQALIAAINQFHYEIYASISAITSPATNVLYLIGPTGSGTDRYDEYVYYNSSFVKIGDTSIDLSGYYQIPSGGIPSSDMASAVQTSLGKADTAYQKPSGGIPSTDIASGVIPDVSGKYEKPSTGIPKTDLAQGVQDSLALADSALQSFTETDPTVPSWAKAQNPPTEIFWATYGTTTAAEIDAAVAAGKAVMCRYGDQTYFYTRKVPAASTYNYYWFSALAVDLNFYVRLRDDNDTWYAASDQFQRASDRVSTWSATPSNSKYPSEKLVKDYIDAEIRKCIPKDYRLIASGTVPDDTIIVDISTDNNGQPFSLSEFIVFARLYGNSGGYTGWVKMDFFGATGDQKSGDISKDGMFAADPDKYYTVLTRWKRVGNKLMPMLNYRSVNNASVKDSLTVMPNSYVVENGLTDITGGVNKIRFYGWQASAIGAGTYYEIYGIDT